MPNDDQEANLAEDKEQCSISYICWMLDVLSQWKVEGFKIKLTCCNP